MGDKKRKILRYLGIIMIIVPLIYFGYSFYNVKKGEIDHKKDLKAVDKIDDSLKDNLKKIDEEIKKEESKKKPKEEQKQDIKKKRENAYKNYVGGLQNQYHNNDVIGQLVVNKTNINYTLVKSHDNNEYLYINSYRGYDYRGAIFVDKDNNRDFSDFNTRIYGHRMLYENTMFSQLRYFLDQNFVNSGNNYFKITSESGEKIYDICASFIIPNDKGYAPINYESYFVKDIREKSAVNFGVDVNYSDNFVTLITCKPARGGFAAKERIAVVGKLRK